MGIIIEENQVFKGEEYRFEKGYAEVFPGTDGSPISVTVWSHIIPVGLHCHRFYELAIVVKGACVHNYQGIQVPLIPGDVFLIEPDQEHGYDIQSPIEIINCQFYPDRLSQECNLALRETIMKSDILYETFDLEKRWNELLLLTSAKESFIDNQTRQAYLNKQGVIHLQADQMQEVEMLLHKMMKEQKKQEKGYIQAKSACLQLLLVTFLRVQQQRLRSLDAQTNQKKTVIYRVLEYMETHLDDKIDFNEMAGNVYWSLGYFRTVFKDVTGLSPIDYLNRLRIIKSLEYLHASDVTVCEAAAKVGIYDASYYTRLFKKIMGYPPKYFKQIP